MHEARLRALIHQLTRDHYLNGQTRVSLLAELQGETMPGRNSSGGGNSDEIKIPVAAGTIDLYRKIHKRAYDDLWKWRRMLCAGTLEDVIQCFEHTDAENEGYFTDLLQSWVDEIENLLRPKKPRRKLHQPCPACNEKYYGPDRAPALSANCWDSKEQLLHPACWDVACAACGAEWKGDEVGFLRASFAA